MRVANLNTMVKVHITAKSSNQKVGKIPVTTTEESSCPTTCPFYGGGCYAKSGFHLRNHWQKVSKGERGTDWQGLTDFIKSLKPNQLWRHNQAGDMPHVDGHIDLRHLFDLVQANKASGAKGYTYTHHLLHTHNKEAIKYANNNGFTINCSTESLEDADSAMNQGMPAVTVIPSDHKAVESYKVTYQGKKQELFKVKEKITTPDGRRVVVCPAQTCAPTKCETCKLCSKSDRDFVVAFVAHGGGKKKVDTFLNS